MSHIIITQSGTDNLATQTGTDTISPQVIHIPHILLQNGTGSVLLQNGLDNATLQPAVPEPRPRHGGIMRTLC